MSKEEQMRIIYIKNEKSFCNLKEDYLLNTLKSQNKIVLMERKAYQK